MFQNDVDSLKALSQLDLGTQPDISLNKPIMSKVRTLN